MSGIVLEFDTRGNDKQKECARAWLDPTITSIVYGGSKGSGKSYMGCKLIFSDALTYPETLYFIARKRLNDLRRYTIPSIKEVFDDWGLSDSYYRYNGQDNYYTMPNGSKVMFIDAKFKPEDPLYERFGSMQFTRGWIEEAGEFSLDAKNNLQAAVGRWKNDTYNLPPKLLMTCNPSKNFLYSDFYKIHKMGKLQPYNVFIQALPEDNKMLPKGYLLNLQRTLTPNQKQRLLYGNWEFDDDPSVLIDYDAIVDLFNNDFIIPGPMNYISSDLATRGRDKWVTSSWRGEVCRIEKAVSFSDPKEMELYLRALSVARQVPRSNIVADSDGLGQWLGSYIEGIYEFRNASRAYDPKYRNLKSECAFRFADKVNNRQMRIECSEEHREQIIRELEVLKEATYGDEMAAKAIIPKDKMKELLGNSPDYLDNFIMKQVFDLKPKSKGILKMSY